MADTANLRIGVDVGGTFTDAVLMDEASGRFTLLKVPSVPDDPSLAVMAAVRGLLEREGCAPGDVRLVVHGTTLGINTLVQRRGTATGLIVTRGFRDILELGRGRLPSIHNFDAVNVPPLVARDLVAEVEERLLASGEVRSPLDGEEVVEKARMLASRGVEAIAVCFLHSYRNPVHELAAIGRIRDALPDVFVSASHEVWPQAREYERAMATVINAYIGGPITRYYAKVKERLTSLGVTAPIVVTRSAGGVMSVESAERSPIETILSGPSSGVSGAAGVGRKIGESRIVCLDMGGTTADVSVVDGSPAYSFETTAAGFTLSVPAIDIVAIGAGGGSVAWVDPSGVLKVGPQSAGAEPGPAAYGRGGTEPTVTDAYLTLGYLDPGSFLGGQVELNADLAGRAMERVAAQTRESVTELAAQVIEVANSNMYAELMPLLSRQGVDLESFALFVYGGAGPTQGFMLAEELGIRRVIVPTIPGGMCALGGLLSDIRSEFVKSYFRSGEQISESELEDEFSRLEREAAAWLDAQGVGFRSTRCVRSADMRYKGQSFDINVTIEDCQADMLRAAFHSRHESVYGHSDTRSEVEIVTVRVQAVGELSQTADQPRGPGGHAPERSRRRSAWFKGGWHSASVYDRSTIAAGSSLSGPALIEQYDTTIVVPPGWEVRCHESGNLIGEFRGE